MSVHISLANTEMSVPEFQISNFMINDFSQKKNGAKLLSQSRLQAEAPKMCNTSGSFEWSAPIQEIGFLEGKCIEESESSCKLYKDV